MTYALNGVPFDNPTLGWTHRGTSKPLADLATALQSVKQNGRHGVLSPMPGVLESPVLQFVVRTPRANLRTLQMLVSGGGVLTSTYETPSVAVEFVSCAPRGVAAADGIVDLSFVFRVPDGGGRGALATSAAVTLGSASVVVPGLFAGLTLGVQDAMVRVKGAVAGLQVTDAGGSWFTYAGSLTGSQYLRFESASGRAFVTTSDVWTGGTEVSGDIDFGGPRGVFEITPKWTTDPAVRAGELTVVTSSRTGAAAQVRGQGAFLV